MLQDMIARISTYKNVVFLFVIKNGARNYYFNLLVIIRYFTKHITK